MEVEKRVEILKIVGDDLPQWSINHYLQESTKNYLKLFQLRRIMELFHEGAHDQQFTIGTSSIDLFPDGRSAKTNLGEIVYLTSKQESAKGFWHYFKYLSRPLVFYDDEMLYDYKSIYAFKVRDLSNRSPVSFSFQGAIETLVDLFRGDLFAARDNEHVRQSLENISNIVEISHKIENSDTPEGVRIFASDQLESIMNHQNKINEELGILEIRFLR